jgi:cbb3-type cytochrome c oxidase subunit III
MMKSGITKPVLLGVAAMAWLLLGACRTDMHVQPRYKSLEPSTFFDDGRSARPPVEGTVARGHLRIDEHLYTGKVNGVDVDTFPFPVTRAVLERGRERFNIFCSPCHDHTGSGNGIIPQRGFRHPPSYHIDRLRKAPVGHFFDVITNGFGAMYSFASRIAPRDRWAIVAYIRALQLSENATMADVPPEARSQLQQGRP